MAPEPEDEINEKNPRPLDEDDIALLKTYVSPFLSSSSRSPLSSFCNLIFDPSFSPLSTGPRSYFFFVGFVFEKLCCQHLNGYLTPLCMMGITMIRLIGPYQCTDQLLVWCELFISFEVDRNKYQIQIPLPPKIDPSVTMMTVEEKPDVTYNDVGGCKEQIEKMRELPMLHPEKFVKLGIDPPKGVLCYGPPGTGKTLLARAVANRTDACFIRVIGSELVQKYVGEGARMVPRFDDGVGGDNEVQRTMLEIVNQLDGFDARGNIKVLMATNRPDTLDPALLRPGRLDRKVEFGLPDLEGRTQIFKIHTRTMNCERDIRFELLARLCPNSTGADIRSVCTEAGMYAIRARRKTVTEKDFLDAVNKVIKGYQKFSATPKYMVYN
ncbi:hypothetical protein BHM03_00021613 [Ensete ventricosum]|nr:hypothetical protein BHM03_00021613 [Ensete ventricosum]